MMQINKITATAGRTMQHPFEDDASLSSDICLSAVLDSGDDPLESAKQLQRLAETLAEDHQRDLLESLVLDQRRRAAKRKIQCLGGLIQEQQRQLDAARQTLDATQQQTLLDQNFAPPVVGDMDDTDEG